MSHLPSHVLKKYAWRQVMRTAPAKRSAEERVSDFREIYSLFDEATVREQASRCIQCPDALCMSGCPLTNRIPEWLALAAEGKFLEAAEISRSTSNMPEVCSRVCPQERLCEGACILNACSEPVSIGAVEKFINEYAFRHGAVSGVQVKPNGRRVAVAGSGPAGMSCAQELAKMGYLVTIFESQTIPGGLLVNGIPRFKLDREVVERRFELLEQMGVKVRLGVRVGRDISLTEMRQQFDAVYLGFGAQGPKALRVPGANLVGVSDAIPFLVEKNVPDAGLPSIEVKGKRVAVLGGGDTAMDCLRTALRGGAKSVICLYRRDEANMPGSHKEFENAIEEGAEFRFLTNPVAILSDGHGRAAHVRCVRMELGKPDASGRRRPIEVPNSEFDVPADVVLVAFGFDLEEFPEGSDLEGLHLNDWGTVDVDARHMTNLPGVFAGGDVVRGASLVVHAVRDGREAAHAIDRYLADKKASS